MRPDRLLPMDRTAARNTAQLIAWGRVGIGITAIAAPAMMARPWIGGPAGDPGARLLARTMGGRDLALGLGALRALAVSDDEARSWVALGGVADMVDALATVLAFSHLPRRRRWGILAVTVGAALVSTRVAESLDDPAPLLPRATATDGESGAPGPAPGAVDTWR